jgi:hypothetical protein
MIICFLLIFYRQKEKILADGVTPHLPYNCIHSNFIFDIEYSVTQRRGSSEHHGKDVAHFDITRLEALPPCRKSLPFNSSPACSATKCRRLRCKPTRPVSGIKYHARLSTMPRYYHHVGKPDLVCLLNLEN